MRSFKVTGAPVQIGQGEHLVLHPDQVKPRKHMLRVIKNQGDAAVLVEALGLLTFKVGEVIGLKEAPKHAKAQLIDIRAAEDAAKEVAKPPAPAAAARAAGKPV